MISVTMPSASNVSVMIRSETEDTMFDMFAVSTVRVCVAPVSLTRVKPYVPSLLSVTLATRSVGRNSMTFPCGSSWIGMLNGVIMTPSLYASKNDDVLM